MTRWEAARERILKKENLCKQLKRVLAGRPQAAAPLIERAENVCRGYHILPGTMNKPYFVGIPSRWHESPVGDDEYLFVLNRMEHWNVCIAAYVMTGDKKFPALIRTELTDWIKNCPVLPIDLQDVLPFSGLTPWRALEVGIRMLDYWPKAYRFLVQEGYCDEELYEMIAGSVADHAQVLMQVSPVLWPNADHNHCLIENLGLFTAAIDFPELPESKEWLKQANAQLERCARNHLFPDGGQVEGCPSYHNVCMRVFCLWALAAKENGTAIAADCLARIRKGLDYAAASLRPTGEGVPWGDFDPDREFVFSALLGLQVFGDNRWIRTAENLMGSNAVYDTAVQRIFDLNGIRPEDLLGLPGGDLPLTMHQRDLHQVMIRSDWSREALSVFFACRIPVQNGHSHIDPAGFDFCGYGKALLVDPGRYTYRDCEERKLIKSAAMHNTLTVNEQKPFDYTGTWSFSGEREGSIEKVVNGKNFTAALAVQTSFFPAIHQRMLALVGGRFLLVWDRLEGLQPDSLAEIWFHMNSKKSFAHRKRCLL